MIHCYKCRNAVIKKGADGKIRVRTRIVIFDNGAVEGICSKCGAQIPLPLKLEEWAQRAVARRLVLRS